MDDCIVSTLRAVGGFGFGSAATGAALGSATLIDTLRRSRQFGVRSVILCREHITFRLFGVQPIRAAISWACTFSATSAGISASTSGVNTCLRIGLLLCSLQKRG